MYGIKSSSNEKHIKLYQTVVEYPVANGFSSINFVLSRIQSAEQQGQGLLLEWSLALPLDKCKLCCVLESYRTLLSGQKEPRLKEGTF